MFRCPRSNFSLRALTCLAVFLSCSVGYAQREFFSDVVTLSSGGVVSDLQVSGDVNAKLSDSQTIKFTQKMADQGCSSGSIFTRTYHWDYQDYDITFCAGMGTVSFAYTTDRGNVCHVVLTDGANATKLSVASSDCLYEFNQISYFNKFTLNFLGQ